VLADNSLPADDHAAEIEALSRRYPRWTIWFGLSTRRWWALPPRDQDIGDFVEAATPQKLIARIEEHRAAASFPGRRPAPAPQPDPRSHPARDTRQDLRISPQPQYPERAAGPQAGRIPATAWPGGPTV